MFTLQNSEIAHVVQLAVAPVFLLSGVATTLNVLASRLARIVDRGRAMELQLQNALPNQAEDIRSKLHVLGRRSRLINRAIALCVTSALLVSLVVVALFVGAALEVKLVLPIVIGFVLAMLTLVAGLLCFLREVFVATAALRFEGT